MNTNTDKKAFDYGEPWKAVTYREGGAITRHDQPIMEAFGLVKRAITCVNACAGMADPSAEIAKFRRERDEAQANLAAMREAVKEVMAVLAQIPDAYDSRFFRAGQWANAVLAKLKPFIT